MEYAKNTYVQSRYKLNTKDINELHALRYNVFHKKMGWTVPILGGMEIDNYDALNPTYIVHKEYNKVVGCMRLLPTMDFYMLQDTFPQLLRGEKAPNSPNIMEISRFAVDERYSICNRRSSSHITYSLLQGIYLYAKEMLIQQYVMVTTTVIERYLRRMGIKTERFGDRQTTRLGKEVSVALKLNVNNEFRNAIADA